MPRASPPPTDHLAATAAVTAALSRIEFPTTKRDAIARVGDFEVPLDAADGVLLRDLLEGVRDEAFHDYASAAKAVDRHWARVAKTLATVAEAERALPR